MFVPEWPSTEGEGLQEPKNEENTAADFAMNGNQSSCINNRANSITADESDAIELTHNDKTGVTSVTSDEEEDGMNQCAMWTASNPEPEQDSTATYTDTNNVLSSFGGGDIWSTEGFSFESPLKDLLDSNIYSLVDLLEQDELLQELRGCETRLIDYFSKPEVVAGLVECMICEVPYADEVRGKERWCKEEKERREHAPDEQEGEETNEEQLNRSDSREATILDTTNEIEASWNSPLKLLSSKNEAAIENYRTPEEEYDLRYCRYPYMACEVLCSDVGETLNVLINGSVQDITIDDDDDSLLNDMGVGIVEAKSQEQEEAYDNVDVYIDEPSCNSSSEPNSQPLDSPPTPHNKPQAPNTRILDLLFSVLIDTTPSSLDDRRAGYFEKILVILFRKYPQAMCSYMNSPIIETVKSKEKAQKLSNNESRGNNGAHDSAYDSLMPRMDSMTNASHMRTENLKPNLSPIDTRLLTPGASSIERPPMLMCALFDHLHSHSIMHIIQRLLLPSAARKQRNSTADDETDSQGNISPNSAINDKFMNHISQMNTAEDENHDSTDDDDVEDDMDNPMDHLFQCDWSDRPTHAMDLLLSQLEGQTELPFMIQYKYPVGYDKSLLPEERSDNEQYEVKLSFAQHASEILIGIIQNSSLESSVMMTLSSDPFLSRIITLASLSVGLKDFVPYESVTTCAMTVLENLILQLGGYGTATTSQAAPAFSSGSQLPSSPCSARDTDASFSLTELGPHTPVSSPAPVDISLSIATTAALTRHLPSLLEELSMMLVHPEAKKWTTPAQYTCNEPRPILGIVRMRIVRLIEALVLLGDPAADLLLQQSDCLECCLDLFWEFEWCSMLHQSVANLLVHVFEAGDHRAGLQDYFIIRCRLLGKLMSAFADEGSPIDNLNEIKERKANEVNTKFDDELVMAMKHMYPNHATSSVESLDGSESDNSSRERLADADDNDVLAHVSEDDVESAMEKEEQDNRAMNGGPDGNTMADAAALTTAGTERQVSAHGANKLSFRRGYMGHVIIICQAIANACGAVSKDNAQNSLNEDKVENDQIHGDGVVMNSSLTADFETSAVHLLSEEITSSKRRLDTSPTRIGEEDIPISPIVNTPTSPADVEGLARSPLGPDQPVNDVPHLALIIQNSPLAERWSSFVSTALAGEISVQAAPLGGQQAPKDSAASVGSDSKNRFVTVSDDSDGDFLGDKGVFGVIDGSIDMNEVEIDIAAEMIESLNLNSSNKDPQPIGHNRVAGGILLGGDGTLNGQERNIGNFGSLIQSSSTIESKGYVYDDPLGCVCQFEKDDSSDDEDMDFAPKGANFDENDRSDLNRSSSTDEDDEDMAPVLDLFTGNFDNSATPTKDEELNGNEVGWANFANFDDAFADGTAAASSS